MGRVELDHVRRFLDLAYRARHGESTASGKGPGSSSERKLISIRCSSTLPPPGNWALWATKSAAYKLLLGLTTSSMACPSSRSLSASADQPQFADNTFDCVTIANAIHMMPDKTKFLSEVKPCAQAGRAISASTPRSTRGKLTPRDRRGRFHLECMKEATLYIERMNQQKKAEGKEPVKRLHGTTRRAFQNRWLNPKEWCGPQYYGPRFPGRGRE